MAKKNQSTMFDRKVEDEDLEALLARALELEEGAAQYRAAKKDIRKRIEEHHAHFINAEEPAVGDDDEQEPSGWVICGGFRFRPKAVARQAGEVKIGAGINWTCPVERIEA